MDIGLGRRVRTGWVGMHRLPSAVNPYPKLSLNTSKDVSIDVWELGFDEVPELL